MTVDPAAAVFEENDRKMAHCTLQARTTATTLGFTTEDLIESAA